ncbi:M23 family metallopeptidase [Umboniibacter marinipuniceus]|uniref:Murein DD-endopeptidase MepM/ murein hydrolase activator NlpD n=1 Tax=Umboniibacter marinipuniceus TaxID=569599 RepID=A0A3M0A873_9GAMM|nr:M23 family metallopeptidase [Umboniibacter marinipuniceus]RMA81371.1 murein DD-endopeptidase MepM/ murein hydrolase activator NlpD [Umboniibacter marinipuniceus]
MLKFVLVVAAFLAPITWACDQPVTISSKTVSGALLSGESCPGDTLMFLDQSFVADEKGLFVIGVGRDIVGEYTLWRTSSAQEEPVAVIQVHEREYSVSIIEGVPQRTVTPSAEDLARIRAEGALVAAAKLTPVSGEYWRAPAISPAPGRISGVYGSQRVYNGTPGRPHYGLDIAAPTGTQVKAPIAGVVVLAESDLFYSGGTIIIAHGANLTSSFLHLSAVSVEVGDVIEQGQVIGAIGATGRATGPHLDWRMNWMNQRVDTQLLLETSWPNTGSRSIEE